MNKYTMKYTKPWTIENLVAEDVWHQWLAAHAQDQLEYQTIYKNQTISLEFFDSVKAQEFAREFGL